MFNVDLARLAFNGRAFDATRPWTDEENAAVYLFVGKRDVRREVAADHVRNGILTLEDFDKAQKIGLVPKDLADVKLNAVSSLQKETKASLKTKVKRKK